MAALLPACAMLEPDTRDVPKIRPVSMAASQGAPVVLASAPAPAPATVPRTYTVARGDTLYSIARRQGAQPGEVAKLNGLAAPYSIAVGRVLRLPGEMPAPATGAGEVPAAIQAAALVRQPASGTSAPASAPRNAVSAVTLPPIAQTVEIKPPGTAIAAAPATAPAPTPPPAAAAPSEASAAPPATPLPVAPVPAAPAAPAQPQGPAASAMNVALPAPPPRSMHGFMMPVEGKVIASFGPQIGGLSNDGINIAAPRGAPVKAAEHGVVVYAGNELRGFGNMLLVRHEGGWMTAYAHLATMAVYRGNKVERGQPIGTVGMTGNVTSPQLHFEIRQGKQPVDPEKQLAGVPARTAQLGALR
ncbi:MAG: M23 family metallopeptidase [Alphaproteobacteria bacterium]|nr:M23 family metallopeptidase [Alphaproteobacteria bacterium]